MVQAFLGTDSKVSADSSTGLKMLLFIHALGSVVRCMPSRADGKTRAPHSVSPYPGFLVLSPPQSSLRFD